ncbi:MAG: hypothetical protein M1813_004330 [Trichoglossum hirsutum]|nr:MAG: hypothetical protein M1813_004330 [Trichoglossum hirsutum]
MSTPITATAFALALPPLPLSSLRAKAAELQNSIAHLASSNAELQSYADAGDKDCEEAIEENREVIKRMEERIELVRVEVERRGFKWGEDVAVEEGEVGSVNGAHAGSGEEVEEREMRSTVGGEAEQQQQQQQRQGRGLSDEQLELALRQRLEESGIDL